MPANFTQAKSAYPELEGSLPKLSPQLIALIEENVTASQMSSSASKVVTNYFKKFQLEPRIHKLSAATCIEESRYSSGRIAYRHRKDTPEGLAFAKYCYQSLDTWQDLIRAGGTAYTADKAHYLNIARQPDTYLVELAARDPDGQPDSIGRNEISLGFALATLGKTGIDDLDKFPDLIQELPDREIARLREVIVIPTQLNFAPGLVTDYLFQELYKLTGDRKIITRIVTTPSDLAYRWSVKGLTKRGFVELGPEHRIGLYVVLPFHPSIPKEKLRGRNDKLGIGTIIEDGIFVFDPSNPHPLYHDREKERLKIESYVRERFAPSAMFPRDNRIVALWSDTYDEKEDFAFALAQEGNEVIAVEFEPRHESDLPYRHNLYHLPSLANEAEFQVNSIGAAFFSNVLRRKAIEGIDWAAAKDLGNYVDLMSDMKARQSEFLEAGLDALKPDSYFAIREPLLPSYDWPDLVRIELDSEKDQLFKRYREEAYQGFGVPENSIVDLGEGRYILSKQEAIKFALDVSPYSDYFERQKDLSPAQYTLVELEKFLEDRGCMIMESRPIISSYVHEHHLDGKIKFLDPDTLKELPKLETQAELVGRKLEDSNAPVAIKPLDSLKPATKGFLQDQFYKKKGSEEYRHLIRRQSPDAYVLFVVRNGNEVYLQEERPRPIRNAILNSPMIDDSPLVSRRRSEYISEGIVVVPEKGESGASAVRRVLTDDLKISAEILREYYPDDKSIEACISKSASYPSSSSLDERWFGVVIDKLPMEAFHQEYSVKHKRLGSSYKIRPRLISDITNASSFSNIGSSIVSSMAYEYSLNNNLAIRPNIVPIDLRDQSKSSFEKVEASKMHFGQEKGPKEWLEIDALPNGVKPFFRRLQAKFVEYNSDGKVLDYGESTPPSMELEIAAVSSDFGLTNNTLVVLPLVKKDGEIFVGLEKRPGDLPLIEEQLGLTSPEVMPAFRVPKSALISDSENYSSVLRMFSELANIDLAKKSGEFSYWEISPEMAITCGVGAERGYAIAVEVNANSIDESNLRFFKLGDLLSRMDLVFCEHTRNILYKGAHALGYLPNIDSNIIA